MAQCRKPSLDERGKHWPHPVGDNHFRIWHADSIPDLSIIWAHDHTHDYPPHLHDCAEIVWIHSGQVEITCRNANYQLNSGDICLFTPNELHSTRVLTHDPITFTLIHLPSRLYWSLASEHSGNGSRSALEPLRILHARSLDALFNAFLEALIHSSTDDERVHLAVRLLETVMITPHCFVPVREEKAFRHPAVIHARAVMSKSSEETINIHNMAQEVGLNVRYFISLFKDGTGLSPHQYQIAMRVERARSLIQGLDAPLSDVAACTGFSDQSHLNRHFKRSYGFTPGVFRQILRLI